MTCKTCCFWEPPETEGAHGSCRRIPHDDLTSLAYVMDSEGHHARLYTLSEFSCPLYREGSFDAVANAARAVGHLEQVLGYVHGKWCRNRSDERKVAPNPLPAHLPIGTRAGGSQGEVATTIVSFEQLNDGRVVYVGEWGGRRGHWAAVDIDWEFWRRSGGKSE